MNLQKIIDREISSGPAVQPKKTKLRSKIRKAEIKVKSKTFAFANPLKLGNLVSIRITFQIMFKKGQGKRVNYLTGMAHSKGNFYTSCGLSGSV